VSNTIRAREPSDLEQFQLRGEPAASSLHVEAVFSPKSGGGGRVSSHAGFG
jgi:hypothetical protein